MRRNISLLLSVLVVLTLVLGACAPTETPTEEPVEPTEEPMEEPTPEGPPDLTGETITLYHFGDLSGPLSASTAPLIHGVEDAVSAINENGGIYGANLEIEFADTASNIDEAVAAYDRFTDESENPIIMFTYGSGEAEALAPRFVEDKVVNLAAALSSKALYEDSGYTFAIGLIYPDQLGVTMKFLSENWEQYKPEGAGDEIKLAYISWPGAFGAAALTTESRAYLEELGIELVAEELIEISPAADTTTAILNAQNAGANVIWTQSLTFGPAALMNDLNALDVRDQFVVTGPNWIADLGVFAFLADPSYGQGIIVPTYYLWWSDSDNPGIQYASQVIEANERPENERNFGYLVLFTGVHVAARALERAIDNVGFENLDGEAVHDALIDMSPFTVLDGVFNEVDFSAGSRAIHMTQIRIVQSEPGSSEVIQDWIEAPDLRPGE